MLFIYSILRYSASVVSLEGESVSASAQSKMGQAAADDKIVRSFLGPSTVLSSRSGGDAEEKCSRIIAPYDADFLQWTWGPNASDHDPLTPPSGFSFTVRANAPVRAGPFHPEKMFYGTAAFCLDGATFRDGSPLSEECIERERPRLKQRLNRAIRQHVDDGAEATLATFDAGTGQERRSWVEQLGGGGAYAGLFASLERGTQHFEKKYWLVVQSGYAPISEDLYRRMEDSDASTTWKQFFLEDPLTNYAHQCVGRNRRRLLYRVAEALELHLPASASQPDAQALAPAATGGTGGLPQVIEPTVETVSHAVMFDKVRGVMAYHCGTFDPAFASSQGSGVLFNESPFLGPVILKGPPDEGKPFGLTWKAAAESSGTFPCGTGRLRDPNTASASSSSLASVTPEDLEPFVWESTAVDRDHDRRANGRASADLYRPRDAKFKEYEAKLGYNHTWGEVQLRPLVVKLASYAM